MLGISGAEIVKAVRDYIEMIATVFAELWFWPVVFVGIMILAVAVLGSLVKNSYENRILKSVNKLNKYFLAKPFITEENLVEFNLKMKKVPKVLRNNWQIYMLNREDEPTKYINVNTCIDKPLRTGSIEKNMQNFTTFTILLGLLSFIAGLQYASVTNQNQIIPILFDACLVPIILAVVYTITILAVRASKNDIYACLYDNFPLYERNLTKAVTTLPAYVDYEILFTKKEIKEGIPILQQYLEKRALVEQQELEKARENSVAVEEYDFSDLGVDGSLILERSMKESETFIKIRRRLQDEIGSIETEMGNYKKNYEETLKDMQRKLQASRENLESLKTQQEESTNRIESNYIRKQQADEIKKQQQLEKDIEEATSKFNDEQTSLQQDIEKREKEIAEKKEFVEQAMALEFKHYANTLYKALTDKATEVGNQRLLTLAQENSDLKALLTDIQGVGGANVDVQDDLIRNEDLTSENLYDMSSNDMNDLNESREQSDENAKAEAEQESAKAQAQQENVQNQAEPVAENQNVQMNAQEMQYADNTNAQEYVAQNDYVDPNMQTYDQNTQNYDVNNQYDGQYVDANGQYVDNNSQYVDQMAEQNNQMQGGEPEQNVATEQVVTEPAMQEPIQVQEAPVQEQPQETVQNVEPVNDQTEDLEQIQRQIDENNKILQKNKQEFENDLNKTISKMDESDDYKDEEPVREEPRSRHEEREDRSRRDYDEEDYDDERDDRRERDLRDERREREERRERPSRRARIDDEDEDRAPARRRATSRRRVDDEEPRSSRRSKDSGRRTGRRTKSTSKSRRDSDSGSDFDELNAEMQKLLNRR